MRFYQLLALLFVFILYAACQREKHHISLCGEILSSTFELSTDCTRIFISHHIRYNQPMDDTASFEVHFLWGNCPPIKGEDGKNNLMLLNPESMDTSNIFNRHIGRNKVHGLVLLSKFTEVNDTTKVNLIFGMDAYLDKDLATLQLIWPEALKSEFIIEAQNTIGEKYQFCKAKDYQIFFGVNGYRIDFDQIPIWMTTDFY